MFIVDRALGKREAEGRPVRVGMVGAGFMARGIALQILRYVSGMELVAISNRTLEGARQVFAATRGEDAVVVGSAAELEKAIASGRRAITDDPMVLCEVRMKRLCGCSLG